MYCFVHGSSCLLSRRAHCSNVGFGALLVAHFNSVLGTYRHTGSTTITGITHYIGYRYSPCAEGKTNGSHFTYFATTFAVHAFNTKTLLTNIRDVVPRHGPLTLTKRSKSALGATINTSLAKGALTTGKVDLGIAPVSPRDYLRFTGDRKSTRLNSIHVRISY